ncbi:hypothetical protein TSUD_282690 [Trifolium subterraneum]|uniref:Ubiquitin-like protease family profile domain-containing protein n=1 Tax=Trifolium subterraneum TaxID=3900 RepID=A0A2Z6PNJ5_TRISU|nr:hypothetical protein TSUD_282690 [Trifolium subterraneum]
MEVSNNATKEKLEILFRDPYMPDFANLKMIYVPIEDHDYQHWYLMVIHIEDRTIYHLDTNMDGSAVKMRHVKMHSIAEALSLLTLSIFNGDVPLCTFPDFQEWDIVEPHGIPNYEHSANSGLWVTEWLQRESCFNDPVIGGMDETVMRMKIVMRILIGSNQTVSWVGYRVTSHADDGSVRHFYSVVQNDDDVRSMFSSTHGQEGPIYLYVRSI